VTVDAHGDGFSYKLAPAPYLAENRWASVCWSERFWWSERNPFAILICLLEGPRRRNGWKTELRRVWKPCRTYITRFQSMPPTKSIKMSVWIKTHNSTFSHVLCFVKQKRPWEDRDEATHLCHDLCWILSIPVLHIDTN
jgi:hypothetical protein